MSRLEIVDSDLVVKLEPGPVHGMALKEQVYFKPKGDCVSGESLPFLYHQLPDLPLF